MTRQMYHYNIFNSRSLLGLVTHYIDNRDALMKWFKHYTNASMNAKFQTMTAHYGIEGYAFVFIIYELMSEQYDGESNKSEFVFSWVCFQNKLRMKRKRIQNQLRTSSELNFWLAEWDDKVIKINCPKFVELRHKDAFSSKSRKKSGGPVAGLDKIREDKNRQDNFAAQFNPMHKQVKDFLDNNNLSSPKIRRNMHLVLESFDSWDEFDRWFKNLKEQARYKSMSKHSEKSNYFTAALLSEIGALNA